MKRLPFSVFKRTGRRFYSVKFKNEETGGYLPVVSTKKETEAEAITMAFQWMRDGIPRKGEAVHCQQVKGIDILKTVFSET